MIEKIRGVSNPLTVIAMFAALTELGGTFVLPNLSGNNQMIYMWFLIVFPISLVVLFFLTLNFNHRVLYSPSDFRNDQSFLDATKKSTIQNNTWDIQRHVNGDEIGSIGLGHNENRIGVNK